MPPRKSNVSQVTATGDEGTPGKEREGINIEDLSLPRTMVQRLAKGVLPPNTSLHKDAILAMQKGATVFVNYLAQAANTASISSNRRTIPPGAVIEALHELEFEAFVPRVEAELKKFNEVQTGKRNEYRRKVKEGKMGSKDGSTENRGSENGEEGEEEGGRVSKRARIDGSERDSLLSVDRDADGETAAHQLRGELNGRSAPEIDEDDDEDDEFVDAEEPPDENGENGAGYDLRNPPDEEEEEEDEDDDEDEYPDEGRRLSSVERETGIVEEDGEPGSSAEGSEEDD